MKKNMISKIVGRIEFISRTEFSNDNSLNQLKMLNGGAVCCVLVMLGI
jgi:hypothetical protein